MTIALSIYGFWCAFILITFPKDTKWEERIFVAITWPLWYVLGCVLLVVQKLSKL